MHIELLEPKVGWFTVHTVGHELPCELHFKRPMSWHMAGLLQPYTIFGDKVMNYIYLRDTFMASASWYLIWQ